MDAFFECLESHHLMLNRWQKSVIGAVALSKQDIGLSFSPLLFPFSVEHHCVM